MLQCLALDTTGGYDNTGICENMDKKAVMEALRGVEVIKIYVKGKVPSSVNFEVLEPCDRCHIPKLPPVRLAEYQPSQGWFLALASGVGGREWGVDRWSRWLDGKPAQPWS